MALKGKKILLFSCSRYRLTINYRKSRLSFDTQGGWGLKRVVSIVFSLVLVAGLPTPGGADFYKYVDEDGVVHLTNVPTSTKFRWVMREKVDRVERRHHYPFDDIIRRVSDKYGVDYNLVRAIVKVESDFNPVAVSEDGARGLMQLMPETARRLGVKDLEDPRENIEGGVRYLRSLLDKFGGQVHLAVAAYNAGEGRVRKYRGVPPIRETRLYVEKVLRYYEKYREARD